MEKESKAKKRISRIIFGTLFFVIFVGLAIEGCQKGLKVLDVLFATSSLFAGEFYNCIDRNGNTILTNSPQDGMKKCVLKAADKDPTPQERAKEQREIEAYRQRMRAGETLRAQASRDNNVKEKPARTIYVDPDPGWYDRKRLEQEIMSKNAENSQIKSQYEQYLKYERLKGR